MRAPFSLPHAAADPLRLELHSDLLAPLELRLVLALAPASKRGKGRRNSRVAHEIFKSDPCRLQNKHRLSMKGLNPPPKALPQKAQLIIHYIRVHINTFAGNYYPSQLTQSVPYLQNHTYTRYKYLMIFQYRKNCHPVHKIHNNYSGIYYPQNYYKKSLTCRYMYMIKRKLIKARLNKHKKYDTYAYMLITIIMLMLLLLYDSNTITQSNDDIKFDSSLGFPAHVTHPQPPAVRFRRSRPSADQRPPSRKRRRLSIFFANGR